MSASLVGSEMCIRDSPTTVVPSPTRRPVGEVLAARAACAATRPSSRLRSCLLYTSDAADDM
eukprot:10417934-Alexandrium_andersonii.AAC.1